MRSSMSSLVLVLGVSILVGGCGDSESPADSTQAEAAKVNEDRKPMSKGDQLVGAWYRIGDADDPVVGMEFGRDSKVMIMAWIGKGLHNSTLNYTVLDGGRIRLTHPSSASETEVLECRLGDSTLEIAPETASMMGFTKARFERLSGMTIAQRHQQKLQELADRHKKAAETLAGMIGGKGLVLTNDGTPRRMALVLDGEAPNWGGKAFVQTADDFVLVRECVLSINAHQAGQPTEVLVQLGNTLAPPGAPQVQFEKFTLIAEPADGGFRFARGGRALASDASAHAEIVALHESILAKQRKLLDEAHAKLGHYVLLDGAVGNTNNKVKFALLRDGDTDAYLLADVRPRQPLTQAAFNRRLDLQLQGEKPILRDRTGGIVLMFAPQGDRLGFQANINRQGGEFTAAEIVTKEQFDARRAKFDAIARGMSQKPLEVSGWFKSSNSPNAYVRPLRLSLSSPDGKAVTGQYFAEVFALEMPVTGTIIPTVTGLVFELQVPQAKVPAAFDEDGTLTLEVSFDGDRPILAGWVRPADSSNWMEFAAPSADVTKQYRQRLDALLAAGGKFQWGRTGGNGGSTDPRTLTITRGQGDAITAVAAFRSNEPMHLAGSIKEEHGFVVIDLTSTADSPRKNLSGAIRLWLVPLGDEVILSGYTEWAQYQAGKRFAGFVPVQE